MKKKCLAAFMMVTVLTLTACGAKETTEDSQQAEEQVTDTADETTAEASQDTEDTENGETAENNENMITELTANTAAEISGKEFTLKTEQAYPDDDEIIAVTAVYGDQELKLDECKGPTVPDGWLKHRPGVRSRRAFAAATGTTPHEQQKKRQKQ